MKSNTSIEMQWIEAWNELYEIIGSCDDVPCLLPDGAIVDVDTCLAWLQDSVYQGYLVSVEAGWVGHRKGVVVSRSS
jgi:hypothetical protein